MATAIAVAIACTPTVMAAAITSVAPACEGDPALLPRLRLARVAGERDPRTSALTAADVPELGALQWQQRLALECQLSSVEILLLHEGRLSLTAIAHERQRARIGPRVARRACGRLTARHGAECIALQQ